ncbi:hypothetical protein SAY87_022330 [Trapa incisa]|uniref:non-specific serine/threonine protein kinase n=1 Tax=Trapa incisa TaxID=236973 RepID=A0AAN7Q572_9MYRT|nr:hypothetical protein SAY87_022330 [Trapa incisa]
MEDAGEPTSSSSSRSNGQRRENRWRKMRGGFSDSIFGHEFGSIDDQQHICEPYEKGDFNNCSYCSGLESPSSNTSTSNSECQSCKKNPNRWRGFVKSLKKGPNMRFYTFPLKGVPKLTRRKSRRITDDFIPGTNIDLETELCYFRPSWKNFTLEELKDATDNFSHDNLIGEGGYSEVYKGKLPDGNLVAIKRLTRGSTDEMTADFLSELGIIVHINHPNIAKLIGYGVEGGMHIILHLSPHGSLASLLYNSGEKLDWGIRYKIAVGTADGLMYLHEDCQRRIIHKDIKAANILLSEDFEPQISDFGLAKWLPEQWTHHVVSEIEGTFGYLPPEYFMHGIVDEKTDVYAYGVLLLELITGRKALDSSQQSLVMWAKPLLIKNSIDELLDPSFHGFYDPDEMDRMVLAASLCIHHSSIHRPNMSQVVRILKGDEEAMELARQTKRTPSLQRTYSEELYAADDYNATKYLSDLDHHMQVVLGRSNTHEGGDDAYNIGATHEGGDDAYKMNNSCMH